MTPSFFTFPNPNDLIAQIAYWATPFFTFFMYIVFVIIGILLAGMLANVVIGAVITSAQKFFSNVLHKKEESNIIDVDYEIIRI